MVGTFRNRAWLIIAAAIIALLMTIAPPTRQAEAGMTSANTHHHHFDGQYTIHHWRYDTAPAGPNQVKWYWKKARHKGNDFSNHTNATKIGYKLC